MRDRLMTLVMAAIGFCGWRDIEGITDFLIKHGVTVGDKS